MRVRPPNYNDTRYGFVFFFAIKERCLRRTGLDIVFGLYSCAC